MISVTPRKPGFLSETALGYSANMPTAPAKAFWNSPSAGSSGMTTSRHDGQGIPAASRRTRTSTSLAGCWAAIWSSSTRSTIVPRRSSSSSPVASFSMPRKV